jgi:hypothetical protein
MKSSSWMSARRVRLSFTFGGGSKAEHRWSRNAIASPVRCAPSRRRKAEAEPSGGLMRMLEPRCLVCGYVLAKPAWTEDDEPAHRTVGQVVGDCRSVCTCGG